MVGWGSQGAQALQLWFMPSLQNPKTKAPLSSTHPITTIPSKLCSEVTDLTSRLSSAPKEIILPASDFPSENDLIVLSASNTTQQLLVQVLCKM